MEMSDNNGSPQDGTENVSVPLKIVIGERLKQLAPVSDSYCIYKVPERLRCLNPDVYTPKVVSIGPLHHGQETLQDMEEHKYRFLQHFLHRTKENMEYYIQKIKLQEAKLRGHYAEPIKFSSDEFVTIILVDSAFIIELLLKHYFGGAVSGDKIGSIAHLLGDIVLDLLLLENQLPLFILEDLYDPEEAGDSEKVSIVQLSRKLFCNQFQYIGVDYNQVAVNSSEVKGVHFLDIARNLCLPPKPLKEMSRRAEAITAPSITELHRAGVKFKVQSTRNLFSIQFHNGVLEIPKIIIADDLELTLRNLAAYEQCRYSDARVVEYLDLLDCFVNTAKDVELLVKYGIVSNILGDSSEACALINSICKEVFVSYDNSYFATLYEDLHNHCKRPWNKWKASLRQNYLNSPWAIVSVVAAAFLILLTIIQTVCSLLSL